MALAAPAWAGQNAAISGQQFDALLAAQDIAIQRHLELVFPEDSGYFVTGPLNPFFSGKKDAEQLYHSVRVLCPDLESFEGCLARLESDSLIHVDKSAVYLHQCRQDFPVGYRGALALVQYGGTAHLIQMLTINQARWLIWIEEILRGGDRTLPTMPLEAYAREVSDHLYAVDRHWDDIPTKRASDFGLFDSLDIYREPPSQAFSGDELYRQFLNRYRAIDTDFASGIEAFVASDSLMRALKKKAPQKAYPDRENRLLQLDYLRFLARGGNIGSIKTLTKEVFQSLDSGEYLFGVGVTGKVRIVRVPDAGEIAAFEIEPGLKAPQANQAFLFPGEPLLTAGVFTVSWDTIARITKISAKSSHYFFSRFGKTAREEIATHSNNYIGTLGHFLVSLDSLGIPYYDVLISKF